MANREKIRIRRPPRPPLLNGEIYHVYNRGVDKRDVFMESTDYVRFIHSMYAFNDTALALQHDRLNVGYRIPNIQKKKTRARLVDILCWCLMPNHFHFMLRQRVDAGISRFMQKLGIGYTNAFNLRYERSGVLFQGKFKVALIDRPAYFLHLPFYIHANPVDLIEFGWKESGIKDIKNVMKFLDTYRWSSYPDFIGNKNFPSLIDDIGFVLQEKSPEQYRGEMRDWVKGGDSWQASGVLFDD